MDDGGKTISNDVKAAFGCEAQKAAGWRLGGAGRTGIWIIARKRAARAARHIAGRAGAGAGRDRLGVEQPGGGGGGSRVQGRDCLPGGRSLSSASGDGRINCKVQGDFRTVERWDVFCG